VILISQFSSDFDRSSFVCGIGDLDVYLKHQLSQDVKKGVAAGFILHEKGSREIIGYYTLSALSVSLSLIPDAMSRKLPGYPQIPATLLGRLAVAEKYQGKGFGEILLLNALQRAWENRQVIASWAVCVDAKDESAVRFYKHFGFQKIAGNKRLFLPMKSVGKLF
jgi:GNAT superfamily N-acetyltransferase